MHGLSFFTVSGKLDQARQGARMAVRILGGVVEWLMAPVLKTGRAKVLVGSNPTPSANLLPAISPTWAVRKKSWLEVSSQLDWSVSLCGLRRLSIITVARSAVVAATAPPVVVPPYAVAHIRTPVAVGIIAIAVRAIAITVRTVPITTVGTLRSRTRSRLGRRSRFQSKPVRTSVAPRRSQRRRRQLRSKEVSSSSSVCTPCCVIN